MVFFMKVWWLLLGILLVSFISGKVSHAKKFKKFFRNVTNFLSVFQLLILLVAIFTNDPLFSALGLPKEYEWVAGLMLSFFILWKEYLKPLKRSVLKNTADLSALKKDVHYGFENSNTMLKSIYDKL